MVRGGRRGALWDENTRQAACEEQQRARARAVIALLFIAAPPPLSSNHPSTTRALWGRVNDYLVKSRPQVRRPIFLPCIVKGWFKGSHECRPPAVRWIKLHPPARTPDPCTILPLLSSTAGRTLWCSLYCFRGLLHPPNPCCSPTSSFYRPARACDIIIWSWTFPLNSIPPAISRPRSWLNILNSFRRMIFKQIIFLYYLRFQSFFISNESSKKEWMKMLHTKPQ